MAKIEGKLEQHPLSALFPPMPPDEFRELVEDIRRYGVLEPVEMLDGKVLDGWHRYLAADEAGVEPSLVNWENPDGEDAALAHVMSRNVLRRHLTTWERMNIWRKRRPDLWERAGTEPGFGGHNRAPGSDVTSEPGPVEPASHTFARLAGVQPNRVQRAKLIERDSPDLFRDMTEGKLTLDQAINERQYRRAAQIDQQERERRERYKRQDMEIQDHYVRDLLQTIERVDQIRKAILDGLRYEKFSPEAKPFVASRLDRAIKWLTAAQEELNR